MMRRETLIGLGALMALGCGKPNVAVRSRPTTAPVSTPVAAPTPRATEPTPEPEIAPMSVVGERTFAALRALERDDGETVRITWLGDSHTAADFWTGEIRRRLQARFGNGGPGFVPLALGGRRHEVASVKVTGTWRQEPKAGASRSRQLDGQFGLSGRRLHGFPGASLEVNSGAPGAAHWSLLYRQAPSQSPDPHLELRAEGEPLDWTREEQAGFDLARLERGAGEGPVEIAVKRGQYLLWGIVIETAQPGLVLDALGINGARLRTILAWDMVAWQNQLDWRKPQLVVLSFGTNEVGDGGDMGRYAKAYAEVVEHVHAAGADCLLAGPTDRQDDTGHTLPEVEALDANLRGWAAALGCLYYSPFLAMGGRGGYAEWRRHKPQYAGTDGVHLTISGYRYLAEDWVRQFLEQYDSYLAAHQ